MTTPSQPASPNSSADRRSFLKTSGSIAAASALMASATPAVHAQGDSTIGIALVGCGGRGTGAAVNALKVQNGKIQLTAMADVFDHRLAASHGSISKQFGTDRMDVPVDRRFIGFDGYKKAMDSLKPGDVVILTTPPAFRWLHFTYAIEKGLNVFMEKPVTVDGPSTKRMLELGKKAQEKNLKVGVGLMCRHCHSRGEMAKRVHDGEIGEVLNLRAYRMAGPTGSAAAPPKPEGMSELMYQIKHFHGFLWLSGGAVSDFLIHNIDEACWLKNDWPVNAQALGGRHYRGNFVDQNFDHYSIEYTFADGTKMNVDGRTMPGCHKDFATYVHGSKGSGIFSSAGHVPAKSRLFKGHSFAKDDMVWAFDKREPNPYQVEWEDLIDAIRQDKPYNEVERGAMASAVTSMGRMAAHTGRVVTLDELIDCDHEFSPGLSELKLDGPSPLQADADGKYPVPMPGLVTDYEYEA